MLTEAERHFLYSNKNIFNNEVVIAKLAQGKNTELTILYSIFKDYSIEGNKYIALNKNISIDIADKLSYESNEEVLCNLLKNNNVNYETKNKILSNLILILKDKYYKKLTTYSYFKDLSDALNKIYDIVLIEREDYHDELISQLFLLSPYRVLESTLGYYKIKSEDILQIYNLYDINHGSYKPYEFHQRVLEHMNCPEELKYEIFKNRKEYLYNHVYNHKQYNKYKPVLSLFNRFFRN
ncbi:MAG: hypothetical protein IPP60_07185 [Sphingobacteriales bacterium]|nr:hypothetical protein [Sphingobacteriales bacterium]